MSLELKNEVQFPKWIFVPLLLDCVTARHWWSFIQISTERKKKTKLPEWFADYKRRLHSSHTSCGGIERICSTFDFMWSGYVISFFFAKWRLYSLWDKTPNGIKDLFLFFITILQIIQFDFTILIRQKLVHRVYFIFYNRF